ncbi:zinc finger protein 652-like [Calliphora vicina]|uniref:zinc finger protein 652-like n=1 Tax=Calliphora vicina TaxID=7373 RepID=UPI00325A571B
MLPVTRAHLDHICCICLLDIRPAIFTQKVYDVKEEKNMSKILKVTAHITVLKNPMNQKYINDYCRKICEICFLKTQYSYFFREKIMASTAALKELLESDELNDEDIKRLQYFCRICLNRQNTKNNAKSLNMQHLNWLKDCSGIRYTSIIDTEKFRIKEGTNINEIAVINDTHFPQQLCQNCLKKLQNVEDFRKSATQTFEYMISVMGDASGPDDDLATQEIKQFRENVIWKEVPQTQPVAVNEISATQDCAIFQIEDVKYEEGYQESFCTNSLQFEVHNTYTGVDPIADVIDYSNNTLQMNDDAFEDAMDFMEEFPHYSDADDDDDADLNLNFSIETVSSAEFSDNADKNKCLRKSRDKNSIQYCTSNENKLSKQNEENIENGENTIKPKRRNKDKQSTEDKNKLSKKNQENGENTIEPKRRKKRKQSTEVENNRQKRTRKAKQPTITGKSSHSDNMKSTDDDDVKDTIVCEKCSHVFATISTFKRHQRTVHATNQTMHKCQICSKEFKRKSHLDDHVRTVHEKLRAFKCSHCTKSFASNSSKRVHELTHTDEFPFACEWCGKRFRQSFRLKVHSEIHTTKPELLCPICKRSQKTAKDLEEHLRSHDDKRLQCPSCGKLFLRSSHLKDHYNAVHLKLRPFKCEFCELAFGDRKTRRVHEKSHTEDRPMTCTVCKRGFNSSISFGKHIKQSGHSTEECKSKTKKSKKNTTKLLSLYYPENLTLF